MSVKKIWKRDPKVGKCLFLTRIKHFVTGSLILFFSPTSLPFHHRLFKLNFLETVISLHHFIFSPKSLNLSKKKLSLLLPAWNGSGGCGNEPWPLSWHLDSPIHSQLPAAQAENSHQLFWSFLFVLVLPGMEFCPHFFLLALLICLLLDKRFSPQITNPFMKWSFHLLSFFIWLVSFAPPFLLSRLTSSCISS